MLGAIGAESAAQPRVPLQLQGQQPTAQPQPSAQPQQAADPYRTPRSPQEQGGGSREGGGSKGDSPQQLWEKYRCRTCENRTYQDGSNDPGVSMKTPTKLSPQSAAAAVMGHEQQHVSRNAIKAQLEGRRVISSSVILHTGICPECGKSYVSGGTTRTVTADKPQPQQQLDKRA